MTENEYQTILSHNGKLTPNPDYVQINGQPYVIGESAERRSLITQFLQRLWLEVKIPLDRQSKRSFDRFTLRQREIPQLNLEPRHQSKE